ncbi:thiamine-phosphate kinase [Variovorax sp. PCZ-1]|uniref:thiamine-phosphate kinase n=1 Tax=Variovorax sp. PCZ-1 TaxID=2835533 RepID=UPI001BCBFD9E|nr:thiamine-phosphate kinase [Variovorax sp. PCZ-1]MBS7808622.1 thiamine-phosphate kinase [Variovorax sp. PCZ-1]
MGEFDLIERYFKSAAKSSAGVDLGIGDDCALLAPAPGMQLAISSDMLVEGRHFLSTVSPEALGHKALAVNLSDLAACAAKPVAFTLALALPRLDEVWLAGFSKGLLDLAQEHGCALIGGDTTAGPLNICITVFGHVPTGQALVRSGAQAGDDIYVSGLPGQARLALEAFRGEISLNEKDFALTRQRMERPTPRVLLGLALRGLATSAIDVSDGLLGDFSHVLKASGVGAEINLNAIDSIALCADYMPARSQFDTKYLRKMVLSGGDDYELVFTAAASQREAIRSAALASQTLITHIGTVQTEHGLRLRETDGTLSQSEYVSFDHFKS